MPEWPHKDMDKLFREGSENYDFEYNPQAWEQMDALLDKQERRRRALWWIWGSLAMFFITVLFSFFFFGKDTPDITTHSDKNNPAVSEETLLTPAKELPTNTHPTNIGQQEKELGETIRQEQALPIEPGNGEEQDARFQQKPPLKKAVPNVATPLLETKAMDSSARPIAGNGTLGKRVDPVAEGPKAEHKNLVLFENKGESGGLSMPGEKAVPLHVLPNYLPYPAIPFFDTADQPTLHLPELVSIENDHEENGPKHPKPSLLIGLLGASEFNSVGQGDYSEMNWKLGFQIEYRFASRFAVKSGANYIHMWYDAGKGEYIPPKGFWVDGIAPVSTRGLCNMVEIPVLLSYHFKGHQNSGFFATAGLASYVILEEHYWYKYDNPPPDPIRYWGTYIDEKDWLNIGHISIGYDSNFLKKLSVQIGPYMQFPLKGVGHGQVEIYSVGLQAVVGFKVK